jgi:WD40 repeat protein
MSTISRSTLSQYPYPGLRPFKREEADIFFGREKQIDQLLEKLSRTRFLAVVGASGCGKSSLVRAGMMAALETGFMEGVGARWRTAEMRPGGRPMAGLAKALMAKSALGAARVPEDPKPERNLEERAFVEAVLRRGPLGLVEVLRETPIDKPQTPPEQRTNLLILVDQFEEIFRYREQGGADEAEAFVALLLATKGQRDFPIYVVITMRSDYLGHCAMFPGLPEAINESEFLTPRMEREERTEAIVGPAELFDGEVEPALVNRLLNDSGSDPDQLPLLQHVLMRIWTRAAQAADSNRELPGGPVITLKGYEDAGGLANALSNDADEAYNELNEAQKRIAELMFKALCERRTGGPDIRRFVRVNAVAAVAGVSPEDVKAVVEVFRAPGRSFLMPGLDVELKPETVLDISHESLIRHWTRLKKWVEKEAEAAEQYRRLEKEASLWDKGRAALWDTPNLELALKWKEEEKPSPKWAERYGKDFMLAMEFLDRSEAKQKEKIAERLEKEQRLKRTVRWAIVASVLAMVFAAVGWWKLKEANDMRKQALAARERGDKALKQMRAATAIGAAWRGVSMARQKLDLALILSGEAFRRSDGREAKNALRASLLASPHLNSFLRGHSTTVSSLAFSPDGQTLASADATGTIILWYPDSGFMVREPISAHKEYIYSIAFSPDGRYLASASADKTVKLTDLASGAVEKLGEDPEFDFWCVAFSPDGNVLAAACGDGSVRRWKSALRAGEKPSFQPIASLVHNDRQAAVKAVEFSPNGKLLVSAGEDNQLVLWDVETATKMTVTLQDKERPVLHVAFSPDGAWIATGSAYGAITLWSAEKLDRAYRPAVEHDREIYGIEFSPDGQTLASASVDQSARLWDVAAITAGKAEPSKSLEGYSEGVYSIAFRPLYTGILATGHDDGTITVWNLSDKPRLAQEMEPVSGDVNALAFGPDGKLLVSAQGKAIVLWDAGKRKWQTEALQGHKWPVTSVAISPRGSLIASASQDGTIRLWDSASGRQLGPSLKGHAGNVNAVAFSLRGDLLASAGDDKTIRLWKISEQRPDDIDALLIAELTGHTDAVLSVAFSPDGNTLASGSADKTVRLWDVQSRKQIRQPLAKHAASVLCVAFHPDGKRLASGDRDGSLVLWDRATGQPLPTELAGHNGASVIGLAFHPNGKTLFSAGWRSEVVQWDLNTGKAIDSFLTDLGSKVISLAVDPSGSLLAAGSADAINVLELTGTKPAAYVLENAFRSVSSLAISHNGKTLAAGGDTGNIICWDTRTNRQKGIPLRTDEKGITRLFFSPDDRLLGAVSEKRIVFWNLATGEEADRLVEEGNIVEAVFDRAGVRLATGTVAGAINLWDWPSLKRRGERLKSHTDRVRSLAFSPDGRWLFSCGDDKTTMQHDLSTAPPTSTPLEYHGVVTRIAYSPDGKIFACGEAGGPIDIYDAISLKRIDILKHHKTAITQLAFSPDGEELASTSWSGFENTIALFDVNTRQLIGPPLSGHKADISGVVFDEEGKTIFSADSKGVIFCWKNANGALAESIAGRGLTKDEAMEYLGEASPPPLSDPATLLKRADVAALKKAPDARVLFGEAVKTAIASKDPEVINNVCWQGSVDGFADVVLPAGDKAVEVAKEEQKAFYRDARGLARALTGKKQEAIEDFSVFIAWAESYNLYEDDVGMRREWIKEMEDNKDPFTDETLRALRDESVAD